jgi:hypothetical protein
MFWKLGLFRSSGKGKEIPTLLGFLERANPAPVIEVISFLGIQKSRCFASFTWKRKQIQFPKNSFVII